jgi:AAA+ ATPase superfamily predicted ATPase
MLFINRTDELDRLRRVSAGESGGLVVVHGRRRIGKTRLLLEWCRESDGLYAVADQSAPDIQRRYFAHAVAARLPGFADVAYHDWTGLLTRLARDAAAAGWRGPVIVDELPYLVSGARELPSVLQRWLDHDARDARLTVALAGSSQRMMQGLVLAAHAPLYGRATELLDLQPVEPTFLRDAFGEQPAARLVDLYAAWGGVPRYWELARDAGAAVADQIDQLVLDPLGPLHREPDRLLLEELPPAVEARPILDAIGAGAHRVSEIAGRIGRPATSMARPLERLVAMGLVRREVPFGEPEKQSRRSLYKIDDPFFRLWFRVVAPHRAQLAAGSRATRRQLLEHHWAQLAAMAWEELCRRRVPRLSASGTLGARGAWGPAARWWRGTAPEWDVVSRAVRGGGLLLGEARWSAKPFGARALEVMLSELAARAAPGIGTRVAERDTVRVLFVPAVAKDVESLKARHAGPFIITAQDLLSQG